MTEVVIEKIVAGGEGLARVDGKVLFVPMSAPGDRLSVEILQNKKGFARGRIDSILEASPLRQQPFCPYYKRCGGCDLQHLSYQAQLEQKTQILREVFRRQAGTELPGIEVLNGPDRGYRQRVQFHQDKDKNLGFKERKGRNIVPLNFCPLLMPALNRFLQDKPQVQGERFPLFGDDEKYFYTKEDEICLEVCGKEITFNVDCFFQSNGPLLNQFVSLIVDNHEGNSFVDLYGGVGLFSLFLQDNFDQGSWVESNASALTWAKKNLSEKLDLQNHGVEHWKIPKNQSIDFAVVDPPRVGMSAKALKKLINAKPQKICYVSCDPVTQARDVKYLLDQGYHIQRASLVDLYPQTSHMETVLHLKL